MNCIGTNDEEPDFEPVTFRSRMMGFMSTAQSSPKLRLTFDNQDSLMTDRDFEDIIKQESESYPTSNLQHQLRTSACPSDPLNPTVQPFNDDKLELPTELQRQLSNLVLRQEAEERNHHPTMEKSTIMRNHGSEKEPNLPSTTTDPYPAVKAEGKVGQRRRPKPLNILPRFGTLTALPGSTMASDEDGLPNPSSTPTQIRTSTMAPPPRPTTQPPFSAPVASTPQKIHDLNPSHKRKLSLSTPLIKNVKRILTPSSAKKKQQQPNITHLTHEATASNRALGGISIASRSGKSTPTHSEADMDTSIASDGTGVTTKALSRDLITPVFAGPSSTYSSPGEDPTVNMHHRTGSRSTAARLLEPLNLHRHRHTGSNASSVYDSEPTSKSELNKLIISLRTQASDLTLENRVLKDQIAIVRKDWVEASRELDVERHRVWEHEMKIFKLRLKQEELLTEIGRLKRGSVFTHVGESCGNIDGQ